MNDRLDFVMVHVRRREHLCAHPPMDCQWCKEKKQFQLVGYINQYPAIWKCRRCKNFFTHEPG